MDITAIIMSLPVAILGGIITLLAQASIDPVRKLIAECFSNVPGYVKLAVKDKKLQAIIFSAMARAQKEFGSTEGREKFRYVKTQVLKACPDLWDGAVDVLIQTLYDEFVKAPLAN